LIPAYNYYDPKYY